MPGHLRANQDYGKCPAGTCCTAGCCHHMSMIPLLFIAFLRAVASKASLLSPRFSFFDPCAAMMGALNLGYAERHPPSRCRWHRCSMVIGRGRGVSAGKKVSLLVITATPQACTSSSHQQCPVNVPLLLQIDDVWRHPVFVRAAWIKNFSRKELGDWSVDIQRPTTPSDCTELNGVGQYLRTHPDDNICATPLSLIGAGPVCVACPDGASCRHVGLLRQMMSNNYEIVEGANLEGEMRKRSCVGNCSPGRILENTLGTSNKYTSV